MTQTHIIGWTAGAGQTMSIALEQEGASFGAAKFPVSGLSRMRWGLSEFGFGGLNQEITLNIVDDDSDTFFNIFDNVRRQDARIVIKVDGDILFVGFADYQQIKTFPYRDGLRELSVKFYNPVSYKQEITLDVANLIAPFMINVDETLARPNYLRVHQMFRSMFSEYAKNLIYVHRWKQEAADGGPRFPELKFGDNAYVMLNQLWMHRRMWGVPSGNDVSFGQIMNEISRTFWFRYGWSFVHQSPLIFQQDTGRVSDIAGDYPYIPIELKQDAISIEGAGTPSANETNITESDIRNTANDSFYAFLPEIDENKINVIEQDAARLRINPYSFITYKSPAGDETKINPNGVDILSDRFESTIRPDETLFDSSGTAIDNRDAIFITIDESLPMIPPPPPEWQIVPPVRFSDSYFDTFTGDFSNRKLRQSHIHGAPYTSTAKSLANINAELHMLIRKDVQEKYTFHYMGIIDPMLNYQFRDKIITLYEGEYDLISGETIVTKSMSIFNA